MNENAGLRSGTLLKKRTPTQVFSCQFREIFKGAVSGLRQLLATDNSLKVMENAFYFTLKALFLLKIFIFTFWSCKKSAGLERSS